MGMSKPAGKPTLPKRANAVRTVELDVVSRSCAELRARLIQINNKIIGELQTKISVATAELREKGHKDLIPDRLCKLYVDELPGYARQLFTEAGNFFRQQGRAFSKLDEDAMRKFTREMFVPWLDMQIAWIETDPFIARLAHEIPGGAAVLNNTNKMAGILDAMLTLEIAEFRRKFSRDNPGTASFPTPPGLQWEGIEMKFVDEQTVRIRAGGVTRTATFSEMGFQDRRKKEAVPTQSWDLLAKLADIGKIGWLPGQRLSSRAKDRHDEQGIGHLSKDWKPGLVEHRMKKQKKVLAETLKAYFGFVDDPFYPYHERHAWVPRFKISPG